MKQKFYIISKSDNCAAVLEDLQENTSALFVGAVKEVIQQEFLSSNRPLMLAMFHPCIMALMHW